MHQLIQLALAAFGLISAYMAIVSLSPGARRWAPVVGLLGQPFWALWALSLDASARWPLYLTIPAFTVVYAKGIYIQWRRA